MKLVKYFLVILLVLVLIIICWQSGMIFPTETIVLKNYHLSLHTSRYFFDSAYLLGEKIKKEPTGKVSGGIIPHHLMVKQNIAAFWLGLDTNQYDTIVLIGPDHFDRGQSNLVTSKAYWETPYGEIEPNLNLIDNLIDNSDLIIDEYPFYQEHSISGLVGFIKKSQPQAKLVPIIVGRQTRPVQATTLALAIKEFTRGQKVLVVSSVDFSHDWPTKIADEHDIISNKAILDLNFDQLYKLDIDSPPSIYILLKYLDSIEASQGELIFSTNSGRLIRQEDQPTTSHNIFYFYNN